ncbi:MAG: YIP1 family protein [Candidatus Binatus sp.]
MRGAFMANGASITPFFTIWTEPRATIRRIVETEPTRYVIPLAAIGPVIGALGFEWVKAKELGNNGNLSVLWAPWAFVAVKAALGVLTLFIGGVVLKWTGSLLGGVASAVELRAAIAWPQVILIGGGIISLLVWVVLGMPVPHFTPGTLPQIDSAFHQFAIVGGMIGGAFHFWCFVVGLKCIGEVHRFSAWRALAATLIPGLIALAVWVFVDSAFGPLIHH